MLGDDCYDEEDIICYEKIINPQKRWEPLNSNELEELKFLLSDEYLTRQTLRYCSSLSEIFLKIILRVRITIPCVLQLMRECLYHMRCFKALRDLNSSREEMERRFGMKERHGVLISSFRVFLYNVHMSMYVEQVEIAKSWFRRELQRRYGEYSHGDLRLQYWRQELEPVYNGMNLFRLFTEYYDMDDRRDTEHVKEIIRIVCSQCQQHPTLSRFSTSLFDEFRGVVLTLRTDALEMREDEELVVPLPGFKDGVEAKLFRHRNNETSIESPDSTDFYKCLNSQRKGLCIIININEFVDQPLSMRSGSFADVVTLKQHFTERDYHTFVLPLDVETNVEDFKNLIYAHIQTPPRVLVLFLMSHGHETGICLANGETITLSNIVECLCKDCESVLKDVPKIVFIQACLGNKAITTGANDEGSGKFLSRIPSYALDLYVAMATLPGFMSFRHPEQGSVFIQTLLRVLRQYMNPKVNVTVLMEKVTDLLSQEKLLMPCPETGRSCFHAQTSAGFQILRGRVTI